MRVSKRDDENGRARGREGERARECKKWREGNRAREGKDWEGRERGGESGHDAKANN